MITARKQNTKVSQLTFVVVDIRYFIHSSGMCGVESPKLFMQTQDRHLASFRAVLCYLFIL